MFFLPIDKMWERVEIGKSESNVTLFNDLMYTGEMVSKIIILGLVASTEDSRDNHRYRMYYELIRADGLGSWVKVVDELLVGPAAQFVFEEAREERRQLTEKKQASWQQEAVNLLHMCLKIIDPDLEALPTKVDGRKWLEIFARLRNKTRGHGAITGERCNEIVGNLENSIKLFVENYKLFQRPWAYLYRNLSGKYRVSNMSPAAEALEYLKSTTDTNVHNGIYVLYNDQLCHVDLFHTSVDMIDFFIANGGFTEKKYELLSYYTGSLKNEVSVNYLTPISELPRSDTKGLKELDVVGSALTNMPESIRGYINRDLLENELIKVLRDDRHPIITLSGRGGIGKTSLSLNVLQRIALEGKFQLIIWLSARDIDLSEVGPKQVQPDIVTLKEIVNEYWSLVDKVTLKEKTQKQIELFSQELNQLQGYGPILFIFDNFETVSNPLEMYNFVDIHIRNPNKALITTRHREFKSDYPIEVKGMSRRECDELAKSTAERLGIPNLLTEEFLEELFLESEGHPYVVKIILGERAKPNGAKTINRIITNRDDILNALFERTYSLLSEGAKRVFFTLSNWRSVLPQLAIEAVLLRSVTSSNRFDIKEAVDELERVSFIEVIRSEYDGQFFLSVPLAAAIFGKRKLNISHFKNVVEADTELLHFFGASQKHEVKNGIEPRILKLFRNVARNIGLHRTKLDENLPMLEFIARQFAPAWVYLADLCEELEVNNAKVKQYLYHYLEYSEDKHEAISVWTKIAKINEANHDWFEYVHALVEKCIVENISFFELSDAANTVNHLFSTDKLHLDDENFILVKKLVEKFESRVHEGNSTDCSRLCWLLLRLDEDEKAFGYLKQGLKLDPNNEFCQKLKTKFETQGKQVV
jgi:hypothetical protein